MKKLLIALILFTACSSEDEQIIIQSQEKNLLIVIREKTFTTSDIGLVLNNQNVKFVTGSSIQYEGTISEGSTFYVEAESNLRYEYDIYEITLEGYELLNDRENYTSPLIEPFEVVTIKF